MTNFQIEYNWFYSTLSQSLAAMIGVVGMFIVYRLQIQQDNINNALSILKKQAGGYDAADYSHLSLDEMINLAKNKIKYIKDCIEKDEKHIQELSNDNNKTEDEIKRKVNTILSSIQGFKERLSEFEIKIKSVEDMDKHKHRIKWLAFPTILWLVVLFILNILGLAFSSFFSQNQFWGITSVIIILLLLLMGLFLIVWCCGVSLDMRKPTELVIKMRKLL